MSKKLPIVGEAYQMPLPIAIPVEEVVKDAKLLGGSMLHGVPEIVEARKAAKDKFQASKPFKTWKEADDQFKLQLNEALTEQAKLARTCYTAERIAEVEVIKKADVENNVFKIFRTSGGRNAFVQDEPMNLNDLNDSNIIAAKGEAEAEKAHKADKRKAKSKGKAKVTKSKAAPSEDFEDMPAIYTESGQPQESAEAE